MFYFRRQSLLKLLLSIYLIFVFPVVVRAEGFDKALIKDIINDAYIYEDITVQDPNRRKARVKDILKPKMALRTAPKSRAELVFKDGTLVRVGTDAMLSFNPEERQISMGSGTALIQQHTTNRTTNIRTATVTASITGTTAMVQNNPGNFQRALVIEGQMKMSMNNGSGSQRTLSSGDMVIVPPGANSIPEPVKVSLEQIASSSALINSFDEDSEEESEEQGTGTQQETTGTDQTDEGAGDETDQQTGTTTDQAEGGEQETGGTFDQDAVQDAVNEQNKKIEDGELVQTNATITETDEEDGTNQTADATETQSSGEILPFNPSDNELVQEQGTTRVDLSKSNQSQYDSYRSTSSLVAYITDGLSLEMIGDGSSSSSTYDFDNLNKGFVASTTNWEGDFENLANITLDNLAINANQISFITGGGGTIEIGNVKLKAVNSISLLAEGTGSSIRFVDNAKLLAGASSNGYEGNIQMAGETVKVNDGVTVEVNPGYYGTLQIAVDNKKYNIKRNGNIIKSHDSSSGEFNLTSTDAQLEEVQFDQFQEALSEGINTESSSLQ